MLGLITATNTCHNCQSKTSAVFSENNKTNSKDLIISLDAGNFNTIVAKDVTLVDFWAPWCQPCLIQGPILENLAADSKKNVKVVKVDVEKHPDLANTFQVRSIPTLILFKNGKPVKRMIGVQSEDVLIKIINSEI